MMSHGARNRRNRRGVRSGERSRWSAGAVAGAVALLSAAAVLGWPRPVAANGRYPLANQLVVDPSNADHLVVRTTFGILRSDNAGASWTWVCEEALGTLQTAEDPALAMAGGGATGATIVAFSQGLSVSRDGCAWSAATGLPGGRFAVDVTVSPRRPDAALAIELVVGAGTYSVQLVASADDGATWTEVGAPLPDLLGTTVEVAPSSAARIYVSGKTVSAQQNVIARSDDAGQTFTQFVVAGVSPAAGIFIGAVDPQDPDVVYLRVSPAAGAGGRVLVSRDGGATFDELLTVPGDLTAFALSPDGATLAVGGSSGLYLGSSAGGAFSPTGTIKPSCLTWVGTRLLACANEGVDPFSIGASDDGGGHFTPLLRLADVTPASCATDSSAGSCAARWPQVAATIGADAGSPAADAGRPPAPPSGGCGCGVSPARDRSPSQRGVSIAGLLGAVLGTFALAIRTGARRRAGGPRP